MKKLLTISVMFILLVGCENAQKSNVFDEIILSMGPPDIPPPESMSPKMFEIIVLLIT